ncbi:MAG: phage portal protein [Pseudomonadota bacterium]
MTKARTTRMPVKASATDVAGNKTPVEAELAFTFGEPESVIDKRDIFDMFEVANNGRWYEPPISLAGLGRAYRMAPHHQSAILLKRNMLTASFVPSRWFSAAEFERFALDWLVMANGYLERVDNLAGRPLAVRCSPAAFSRVGLKPDQFFWCPHNGWASDAVEYRAGSIFHIKEPDPMQEIYGMPEYLSALQSGLLNEAATIFRRRYYLNGSHAGFILYLADEGMDTASVDSIRKALRGTKGMGNFKNLFIHSPKGKPDGIKLLPIAEVGSKDEFLNIKAVTSEDLLAAHRVPPQLLGIVPKNTGGFGNVNDAAAVFYEMEIVAIQRRMLAVNDWLGVEAVKFERPAIALPVAATGAGTTARA